MPGPNPTTTIRIERPVDAVDDPGVGQVANYTDPWIPPADSEPQIVAEGLRAHIGTEKGRPNRDGANLPEVLYQLSCELCDLRKDDFVVDEVTLVRYRVDWTFDRVSTASPMLDRTRAGLMVIQGAAADPVR